MKAPATKILNHLTKSIQDSDRVGKVGVEQKGTHHRCEVSETLVPRKQLPRWGDSGVEELPPQLEQIPASHCWSKPSSWALLWDFGTPTSRLMNNQWLRFICLETPKVWVFQTSASTSWAVTGVSPTASQTNKIHTASKLFDTVKVTCVLTAHRLSASCTSAWTRIKRFQFPSNKEMNGTWPGC